MPKSETAPIHRSDDLRHARLSMRAIPWPPLPLWCTMPPQPPPSLPPRYRLWPSPERAHLGSGGAASVWRVKDDALDVEVALKVLKEGSSRFQARLEREAVLASRVVHPNVIALHDVGRTPDGHSYMAFPLANEGSMLELAPRLPTWVELQALIIQLLQALAAMHARDILHLDVKLSNLLLHKEPDAPRVLWLADLGVARALTGEDDDDKSVVGTVSYMASERLTGQHHLWCPATDLFAVGAVIYRLLTGVLPFPSRTPTEGMKQRMRPPKKMDVRAWLNVPSRIDEVVLPMLQFDPRSRYDLASDAIRAFQSLGEPEHKDGRASPGDLSSLIPAPTLELTEPTSSNPSGRPEAAPPQGVPAWYRPTRASLPHKLVRPPADRAVPQTPALMVHREIELVGRDAAFEHLWRATRTAVRNRRPMLVEIKGSAGVGRTRLVEEFTRTLEELGLGEGVRMVYGAIEGPQTGLRGAWRRIAPPGSEHIDYIREIATLLARDRGARWQECMPDAEALAGWLDPQPDTRPTRNRGTMRGMLVEHLARRSWRGVSWLWIEDADQADGNDDCWPIIDQLLSSGAPVIILVSTRPAPIAPSMLELRARHHRSVRTVPLAPLGDADAQELVQAHLPLHATLAREVAQTARGMPRSIHDLLAWWIRTGMLREEAEPGQGRRWVLAPEAPPPPADATAFAQARLAEVHDPARLRALRVLALSGPGTPEAVMNRVAGEAFDQAVVDGLIDLSRGLPAPDMPELDDVAKASIKDPTERIELHRALAEAWALEGDDPRTQARVGRHRFACGDRMGALEPLDLALRGLHQTLPVPELRALARQTLNAANAVGQPAVKAWTHAALVLADARWRQGDRDGARTLDQTLIATPLRPAARVRATCAAIRRAGAEAAERALPGLQALEVHLPELPAHCRAELRTTTALVRAWTLDNEGALADLHDALASSPRPDTACRARLLRARLLKATDPMVGWHEVLRTVEVARGHGLLRYEILAWSLAGEDMVMLGRTEEAIERLRSGVGRLLAHGETRAAVETRLHLGLVLRAAGRLADAHRALSGAMDGQAPPYGTAPLSVQVHTALLAALASDGDAIWDHSPSGRTVPADDAAWALLLPLASLLEEEIPAEPPLAQVQIAPNLGPDGLFLARAVAALYRANGRSDIAVRVERNLAAACQRLGVGIGEGDTLLDSFMRGRR